MRVARAPFCTSTVEGPLGGWPQQCQAPPPSDKGAETLQRSDPHPIHVGCGALCQPVTGEIP